MRLRAAVPELGADRSALVTPQHAVVPNRTADGTVAVVSTNLRLSAELAGALRAAAARTGRSQQDIVREAIAKELGLSHEMTAVERAVRAGVVEAPAPFRDVEPRLTLPAGRTSLELLDREDR